MRPQHTLILITAPDTRSANRIAAHLLEEKLAACVNQIPRMRSRYWWKGKIESCKEILLLVKTRDSLIPKLSQHVKKLHPYSTPEVIGIPILDGHKPYLQWIDDSVMAAPEPAKR